MKKILKKFLVEFIHKRITKPSRHNYFFYRWLVSVITSKKENLYALAGVSCWLYNNDNVYNVFKYTDMFFMGRTLYILTVRPGVWIGKGGETIEKFKKDTRIQDV